MHANTILGVWENDGNNVKIKGFSLDVNAVKC